MPTPVIQAINVRSGESESAGTLHAVAYDHKDRIIRAVRIWLICWLGAVLAFITFIPVAHLVLSFGLLIAGPAFGMGRYRAAQGKQRVNAACPACGQAMALTLEDGDTPPKWTYCPVCGAPIHIIPAASA